MLTRSRDTAASPIMLAICSAASRRHRPLFWRGCGNRRAEVGWRLRRFEIDPAVGDDVEGGETLGGAGRVIVAHHLADAVAETNGFGARRRRPQHPAPRRPCEYSRGSDARLPRHNRSRSVGQFDLLKRLMKQIALVALIARPPATSRDTLFRRSSSCSNCFVGRKQRSVPPRSLSTAHGRVTPKQRWRRCSGY